MFHPNHNLNSLGPNHNTIPQIPVAEHQPLSLGNLPSLKHLEHGLIHDFPFRFPDSTLDIGNCKKKK
jgi:hypothetical protein